MNTPGTTFQPGMTSLPTSTVELSIRCENLPNKDLMSKSDPLCVVYMKQTGRQTNWFEVGRTEHIQDTLNPAWQKKFLIEYKFEERQALKFAVYDVDSISANLDHHDFLGSLECSLGEVVSMQSKGFTRKLDRSTGTINILVEELSENKEIASFMFSARKLDKKDFFGLSDPYLEISRSTESNQYVIVHRTEVIKNNLNPKWKQFQLEVKSLCNGDYDRDLKFEVFDWNSSGNHESIGIFHTNMRNLKKGPCAENVFDCIKARPYQKIEEVFADVYVWRAPAS